jgi:hypothetical protein
MKTIYINKNTFNDDNNEIKNNNPNEKYKKREIIKTAIQDASLCKFIEEIKTDSNKQLNLLYDIHSNNDKNFIGKKFIINEIRNKINNYKSQDKKKNLHDNENLITINNIIQKLIDSNLSCYYCKCNLYLIFESVRYKKQWTLDRLNNLDEHSNENTIISCLECNLQRRRKNSDKFLFTKKIETNQIIIKKVL